MKMRKTKENELSISDLARLKAIFDKKCWPIEDEIGDSNFDNFCNWLKDLSSDQSSLMLKLTEDFLWVRDSEYVKIFLDAFASFAEEYEFSGKKSVIICPLIREEDFGKGKSSIMLLYLIKARLDILKKKYPQLNIGIAETPKSINCASLMDSAVLCLVDDFIGSGKTAISAAAYFIDQGFPISQIAIISLVSMESGMKMLKNEGYNTYTSIVEQKGITGRGRDEEKEKEIMQAIEAKLMLEEEFKFGYDGSEALVKMIRTPNNTFPIYWYRNMKKGINKFAPFPR